MLASDGHHGRTHGYEAKRGTFVVRDAGLVEARLLVGPRFELGDQLVRHFVVRQQSCEVARPDLLRAEQNPLAAVLDRNRREAGYRQLLDILDKDSMRGPPLFS